MRAALTAVVIALAAAAPAAAQDPIPTPTPTPTPEPTIAAGVTAAGVDLSGQTVSQAEATLHTAFDQAAAAPVTVAVAGRRFTLKLSRVKYGFDANRSARRAYNAGKAAAGKPVDVPLAIDF